MKEQMDGAVLDVDADVDSSSDAATLVPATGTTHCKSPFKWHLTFKGIECPLREMKYTVTFSRKYPLLYPLLSFIDACLRSVGQVVFCNNPISGFLILLAMACSSIPMMALCCIYAVIAANAFALFMRFDRDLFAAGIWGYNAALVGCALFVFTLPADIISYQGAATRRIPSDNLYIWSFIPLLSVFTVYFVRYLALLRYFDTRYPSITM